MVAKVVWITYWTAAFGVAPVIFRYRFGRWPFVFRLPRDKYAIVEYAYGALLATFTWALIATPSPESISIPAGLTLIISASVLQAWAEWTLGRNYRIGQDPNDTGCQLIVDGPYRFMRHPVYVGLVMVVVGQTLLMDLDWRASLLILVTLLYYVVQGRAEVQRWGA